MSTPPDPCKCCKPRYIKFKLTEGLTVTTEKAEAEVQLYWDGIPPDDAPAPPNPWEVDVYNLEIVANLYVFQADVDDVGYAVWDDVEDKYRIFYLPPKGGTLRGAAWLSGTQNVATTDGVVHLQFVFGQADSPYSLTDHLVGGGKKDGIKIEIEGRHLLLATINAVHASSVNPVTINDGDNLCNKIRQYGGDMALTLNDEQQDPGGPDFNDVIVRAKFIREMFCTEMYEQRTLQHIGWFDVDDEIKLNFQCTSLDVSLDYQLYAVFLGDFGTPWDA